MVWKRAKTGEGEFYYYETVSGEKTWERPETFEEETVMGAVGLVKGYSSSSEEEEEEEEEQQQQQQEQQHGVDISKPLDVRVGYDSEHARFIALFDRYELNPYSSWSLQSRKVQSDPEFYTLLDDETRRELFEDWCTMKLAKAGGDSSASLTGEEEEEEDDDDDEDESLEPVKFHYLSHIVSKSTIKPQTVFSDVKTENKLLFKNFNIDETHPKQEQRQFVSSLLFYYKKKSSKERVEIFKNLLDTKVKHEINNEDQLQQILDQENLPNDAYEIESQLITMEKYIGMHDSLRQLQEDIKYYVVGVRDKTILIKEFLRHMVRSTSQVRSGS
ncbi:Urn1p Ecym_1231 [Eremothecium cymbalariae DBVPG|uniref:WW domain-containing protein n=1 Tax=Eremothecium cymbalariae (strain CBS 270.75 / DBVPG 7215 / KCTC 17166 / NRRL Y-17582) TaxID=931890 RepID=G8JN13_ERECY|nr:hypothetical protein Ecym_1231 [Eremothecium cymbalariae DBVPG\